MRSVYADGQMQASAERVLALATQLADEGFIDVYLFGFEAWYAGELVGVRRRQTRGRAA